MDLVNVIIYNTNQILFLPSFKFLCSYPLLGWKRGAFCLRQEETGTKETIEKCGDVRQTFLTSLASKSPWDKDPVHSGKCFLNPLSINLIYIEWALNSLGSFNLFHRVWTCLLHTWIALIWWVPKRKRKDVKEMGDRILFSPKGSGGEEGVRYRKIHEGGSCSNSLCSMWFVCVFRPVLLIYI